MSRLIRVLRPAAMLAIAIAGLCAATAALAAPVGTSFTYQGKLQKDAAPYTGTADLLFRLHDDPDAGNQVGADVTLAGVTLTEGLFTVDLDFGNAFDGTALWLEVQVLTPGDADYTALLPRQLLAAAPYALHALSAPGGGGASQWTDDLYGITHPGNVGIGTASRVDRKLIIDNGASGNALWLKNNTANYAALAVQNDAVGGIGLADVWSDKHYVTGDFGFGMTSPVYPVDAENNSGPAGRFVSTGSIFTPGIRAAMYVHGLTGSLSSGGIYSSSTDDRAISGWSTNYWGVSGDCTSAGTYGVLGTPNEGLYASSPHVLKPAGKFVCPAGGIAIDAGYGLVKVKTLQILGGADLAERFDVSGEPEPGTVLTIDPAQAGQLRTSDEPYSHRVAGVVSGANQLDAGVVLSKDGRTEGTAAVALSGRVWVKCDASSAPIAAGDLLTTAARSGHAMKAADRDRSQGAVLGKAMTALESGTGMVLVLVSLQ